MDRLIAIQPCPTCRYAVPVKTLATVKVWQCRRYPPTPMTVPVQVAPGNFQPQVQSMYPGMASTDGCGEGLPSVKVAGESEPIPDREVEGAPV